jgi:hypothetical protein
MKTRQLTWAAGLMAAAASALAAELVITSAERNGTLTWTNSLSNAVYRIQWSNTVTSSWTNFQSLAALDCIQGTGGALTAQVPVFYRVVAEEKPSKPDVSGVYLYDGYNATGYPLVTGWLSIGPMPGFPELLNGTWSLGYVGDPTGTDPTQAIGQQLGKGELRAGVLNGKVVVDLTPNIGNYSVGLEGTITNGQYTGSWFWTIFGDRKTNGTFSATKHSNCPK